MKLHRESELVGSLVTLSPTQPLKLDKYRIMTIGLVLRAPKCFEVLIWLERLRIRGFLK